MMLGEFIWGPFFLEELRKPHSDPVIRKMEEQCAELTRQMLVKVFSPRQFDNQRWIPAHYRGKK